MCAESVFYDDTPNGTGDCFMVAAHEIEKLPADSNARLVHALVSTAGVPEHWHAWVEFDEWLPPMNGIPHRVPFRTARDVSNGHEWHSSASYYRKLGNATNVAEYTLDEAHRMMLRTHHYGPWHGR